MLCPKCGYYAESDDNVCPSCGNILKHPTGSKSVGAEAIRQGKRAREAVRSHSVPDEAEIEARKRRSGASHATVEMPAVKDDRSDGKDYFDRMTISEHEADGPLYERRRRSFYDNHTDPQQAARYTATHHNGKAVHRRMVNWIKLTMIIICLVVIIIAGIAGYLKFTTSGQTILTRTALKFPNLNLPVTSSSLWSVGEEYMNEGQVQSAIHCFEMAREMNNSEALTKRQVRLRTQWRCMNQYIQKSRHVRKHIKHKSGFYRPAARKAT